MRSGLTATAWSARNLRMDIDEIDNRLLQTLQKNGQATAQELSDALGLSPSQAGRRRQRLEAAGLITHYAAQIDPEQLGLSVQAFVQVHLGTHGPEAARDISRLIHSRAEITSAWTMTGEADYLLRVWTSDLKALHRLIHDVLLPHTAVARVQSQIVMDQLKSDAPLPL